MTEPIVRVRGLTVRFPVTRGVMLRKQTGLVRAVEDLDLDVWRGETLGLVGESGCGKSTTGRAILRLLVPTAGEIWFDGVDLAALPKSALRPYRRRLQIVFQDPYASLDPRMTAGRLVAEPMQEHRIARGAALNGRVEELLELVGLSPSLCDRYPHELSGGQRQRVGIARALSLGPELVVCDEPVSALDVSVQAQVLRLLSDLQERLGLTYLFISHDLATVRRVSDRIAVMYLGRLVEIGAAEEMVADPRHPYTKALISAVPVPDPVVERRRRRIVLAGDVPSALDPPSGCALHPRCAHAVARCRVERPELEDRSGRRVACHLA